MASKEATNAVIGVAAIAAVGVGGYLLYNYFSRCKEGELYDKLICPDGEEIYEHVCTGGELVSSGQACVNRCQSVGPCIPSETCVGSDLYDRICDPATGACKNGLLLEENSYLCIPKASYIEVHLGGRTGPVVNGMTIEAGSRVELDDVCIYPLLYPLIPVYSFPGGEVTYSIRVLDDVLRGVPDCFVAVTQDVEKNGGFVGSDGKIWCTNTHLGQTDQDGWLDDVRWVGLYDDGAGVVNYLSFEFYATKYEADPPKVAKARTYLEYSNKGYMVLVDIIGLIGIAPQLGSFVTCQGIEYKGSKNMCSLPEVNW